ncbi:5847_t:CDS:2 [Gigaspora margarita]|uniref:5847_t:CDS:1 n=1 Tax=Gigaspora margarita TaxID=4874 RepID=A0ABN7UIW4_GIGMA|nr:5847_t:CDS:2 [Gigaspora margarita]
MVEMYVDFHHNDGKIYFWFDDERKRNLKYNHVSFKLDSFKYLEKVMKEEENRIEKGEIDREEFKIKCLKENWHIFIVMLVVNFYYQTDYITGSFQIPIEETSCVDNCNRNKIQVRREKVVECCLNRAENRFATGQFDPGGPYSQNEKGLEHICKN